MSSITAATRPRRLGHKTAVIFGAGGEIGSAVATELAAQGARVFLSGRTKTRVQQLAQAISSRGETAAASEIDALDEDTVTRYLDDVVATAGRIDILFNAMGPQAMEYRNATSTLELPIEAFMLPITMLVRSQFITARAAAREGDFDALVAVLDPDIVERADTGSGTLVEVRGAANVARRAMAAARPGLVVRPALVNGAAGWVAWLDGEAYAVAALTLQNGRITTMDVLLDPARLARLDLTAFDPRP